jgi:lipopolysaccharide biosynthesis glycosyltransferase
VKGDRALYLDVDIVVIQRIDDLYDAEISNTFLAAVDDMDVHNYHDLEMESSAKYFNSGVMLINLEYWRAYNIKGKVIEFVSRKPEVIRWVDQDGLNSVINGNWLELHPKYNLHTRLLYIEYDPVSPIKEAIDNPVIIHYTGPSKPWYFRNKHPYKHLYWKYLKMTPYKYFIPDDFNIINVVKWIVPMSVKQYLKNILNTMSPKKNNESLRRINH